jgi:HK97 family phage major capsid protein/HK97 family phage prohead protease
MAHGKTQLAQRFCVGQSVRQPPVSVDLLHRSATLRSASAEGDTFALSFSSTEPVERIWGPEILDHSPGAVDLSRVTGGVAPLLLNHDPSKILGKLESATIANGKGRAICRWGTSPLAAEVRADVEAGILSGASVGYVITETEPLPEGGLRATKWALLEVSLCSVPADSQVGVNRSHPSLSSSEPMTRSNTATPQADSTDALAGALERITDKLDSMERRAAHQHATPATQQRIEPIAGRSDLLPLTRQEEESYSIVRALRAAASGDWSQAGFERECSRALAAQCRREAQGFFMPSNVYSRAAGYNVGTASVGGNLVATELHADKFIDALRNSARVVELGATTLPGLVGNVAIPKRTGTAQTYWVGESQDPNNSAGSFIHCNMSPKTVGALSNFSRLSQLQTTPEIEMLIRDDFTNVVGLAIDLAALRGTGSEHQPLGILGTEGIKELENGNNGAAVSYDMLALLKGKVSAANADTSSAGYLLSAATETALQITKSAGSGEYLAGPTSIAAGTPPSFWNRRYAVSNQLRDDLSKGSTNGKCSEIFYGNWSDLLIGLWGPMDVLLNPYGSGYAAGDVEIRVLQSVDIAVRHPESFAVCSDAITSA